MEGIWSFYYTWNLLNFSIGDYELFNMLYNLLILEALSMYLLLDVCSNDLFYGFTSFELYIKSFLGLYFNIVPALPLLYGLFIKFYYRCSELEFVL